MTTPRTGASLGPARPPTSRSSRFGLSSTATGGVGQSRAAGTVLGVVVAAVLVGGLVWSAATGQAPPSQRPRIFGGELVLDDYRPLTVIDLATGEVTVQLEGVDAQVGSTNYADVQAVATAAGTMLINDGTGTFNMLGKDDYVLGPSASGISLGALPGATGATGLATSAGSYIVRFAPRSTVSLVDAATVEAGAAALAAGSHRSVRPLGFAQLGGPADSQPGGSTVAGNALWLLVGQGEKCRLEWLAPSSRAAHGLAQKSISSIPTLCQKAALETSAGTVGLALPGEVLLRGRGETRAVSVSTEQASELLPVQGAPGELWYLAKLPAGWSVFGVSASGIVSPPRPLASFGPGADPVVPAYSAGMLYTLDQDQPGQPTLWAVRPSTGVMRPVAGVAHYPAKSVTEKASFVGAQVLVDGPRVIFNNPESLLAVVVFTDGSHSPVIVDKSTAVVVSAAGPGDVNVKPRPHRPAPSPRSAPHPDHSGPPTPTTVAPALAQPVTQQVTCATTTEKPYQPQISSVKPADESALVVWSYHLLAEQDCLPSTWSVTVTALGGGAPPAHPVQVVNGQQQLLFGSLTPGTTYEAVVTAYINKQSTESAPARFTTTAVGPGAPSSVRAVANGAGGWVVSWASCRGPKCEVAAHGWTVTGSSCGTAFVGRPPTLSVPGPLTSVTVNPGNNLGLLGDSLQFSVQGVSATGLVGAPGPATRCLRAWQPPDPNDLQLLAAGTVVGQTITAGLTVAVVPGASSVLAYGGNQVTFTYSLANQTEGPTPLATAAFPGLRPARSYQASVTVMPLGHPAAAVTLAGAPFGRSLPWPPGLGLKVTGTVGANPNSGTATASFPGLPPGPFEAQGDVICGSEVLTVSGRLSAAGRFQAGLDLDQMGGRCDLQLALRSTLQPDPYGLPSPVLRAPFSIGAPPAYSFAAVAAQPCPGRCDLDLYISFNGSGQPAGTDWLVSASSTPGCTRATSVRAAASFPVTLQWPAACPPPTVTVSWVYLGQPTSTTASLTSPPSPPPTEATRATTTTTAAVPTLPPPPAATTTTVTARSRPTTTTTTTTTSTTTTTTAPTSTTSTTAGPCAAPGGTGDGGCAVTTAPTTTTVPCQQVFGSAPCPPTTTTTTTAPTTTTTSPPAATTTVPTTVPTAPASTTTTTAPPTSTSETPTTTSTPSTGTTPTTCDVDDPECSQFNLLSVSGRPGPGSPPGTSALVVGTFMATTFVAVCLGALCWPRRRRPQTFFTGRRPARAYRARARRSFTMEATT